MRALKEIWRLVLLALVASAALCRAQTSSPEVQICIGEYTAIAYYNVAVNQTTATYREDLLGCIGNSIYESEGNGDTDILQICTAADEYWTACTDASKQGSTNRVCSVSTSMTLTQTSGIDISARYTFYLCMAESCANNGVETAADSFLHDYCDIMTMATTSGCKATLSCPRSSKPIAGLAPHTGVASIPAMSFLIVLGLLLVLIVIIWYVYIKRDELAVAAKALAESKIAHHTSAPMSSAFDDPSNDNPPQKKSRSEDSSVEMDQLHDVGLVSLENK